MEKAASIFLRSEIWPEDVRQMIRWLRSSRVTRYLHEDSGTADALVRLLDEVPAELLTCHFNQRGRFFLICRGEEDSIGFIRMQEQTECGHREIVFAIGEDALWGNGYGTQAVEAAERLAFLDWRCRKLTAKIYHGNLRSVNTVRCCGFALERRSEKLDCYSITLDEYLRFLRAAPVLRGQSIS